MELTRWLVNQRTGRITAFVWLISFAAGAIVERLSPHTRTGGRPHLQVDHSGPKHTWGMDFGGDGIREMHRNARESLWIGLSKPHELTWFPPHSTALSP